MRERTSYPKLFGFGAGALGLDLSYGLFFTFLSFYFTDILFLSPLFLMVMTFAARVFDGVNDPFIGALIDRTKAKRLGKYRFWMIIGTFTNAIVLVFLFTNPWGEATVPPPLRIYIYATVLYFLWDITDTLMDAPYWSMVPSLENDPSRRNIVATIPRAFSGMGQAVIVVATPLMIPFLGRQGDSPAENPLGFQRWAIICAAAMVVLLLIAFFTTGKIDAVAKTTPSEKKITLREVYRTLRNNDQLPIFVLVAVLANTGWYLVTGLSAYYFEHVLGNMDYMALFGMITAGGMAVGLGILPVLTRYMRRNTVIKIAMCMAIVGYLGMYGFSMALDIFPLFVVFGLIGAMGVSCCFVSQTVMLSDLVDYGEFKLGYRSDALVFSMRNLLQKIAYAVQALVMFAGLYITGYDATLPAQPQTALTGISVMMFLIPPVLVAASLFVFSSKYKLNEEAMAEVNESLNAKAGNL